MATLQFPLQFLRQYAGPIDTDIVFDTTTDMNNYLTNARRYAGQIVSCLDQPGTLYVLNSARDDWVAVSGGSGTVDNINDIGDVSTTGVSNGQVLKYSSGTWVADDDTDTTYSAGTGMSLSGTTFNCTITQYADSDAVSAIKADADWNATNWDTAYSWGNHANAGYASTSSSLIISSSIADSVTTVTGTFGGTEVILWTEK